MEPDNPRDERDEERQPQDRDAKRKDNEAHEGPPWTDDETERDSGVPAPEPPPWP